MKESGTITEIILHLIWCIFADREVSNLFTTLSNLTIINAFGWRRQWKPTPVLLPGKSHGRKSLVGCSPWGQEESETTERLQFHFSLSCIGEGNGNPLQCSCLENSRDEEPGGLLSVRSHRVGHDWSDLAAAAAAAGMHLADIFKFSIVQTWEIFLHYFQTNTTTTTSFLTPTFTWSLLPHRNKENWKKNNNLIAPCFVHRLWW